MSVCVLLSLSLCVSGCEWVWLALFVIRYGAGTDGGSNAMSDGCPRCWKRKLEHCSSLIVVYGTSRSVCLLYRPLICNNIYTAYPKLLAVRDLAWCCVSRQYLRRFLCAERSPDGYYVDAQLSELG